MTARDDIVWAPANDEWMAEHGFMEWQCGTCGNPLTVEWTSNCQLLDTDEPIRPQDAVTSSWQVECYSGHVLLLCHECGENESVDTYDPPTTKQIALLLASEQDIIEWENYTAPKPPWTKAPTP